MRWKTAGLAIFWLTLLATFFWAFVGYELVATAFLIAGLILTAEAFVASKAEEAFPFPKHHSKLGLFSCILTAHGERDFERVALKVDAKNLKTPFELEVHARKIVWNAKKKAQKDREYWARIVGLVEADVDKKTAKVSFEDEPNIRKSISDTLKLLEKTWR